MAEPVRQDLTCYKGQTYSQDLYFKKNKQVLPLTGITAKSQIRPSENSAILTAEFQVTVYDSAGMVTLFLSDEVTAAIAPGSYAYDLKFVDGNEIVKYWVKGQFIVTGRVTV